MLRRNIWRMLTRAERGKAGKGGKRGKDPSTRHGRVSPRKNTQGKQGELSFRTIQESRRRSFAALPSRRHSGQADDMSERACSRRAVGEDASFAFVASVILTFACSRLL